MDLHKLHLKLISRYRNKGSTHFKFEKFDVLLPQRVFNLVCYCISKNRPTNKTITTLAWNNIGRMEDTNENIYNWFQMQVLEQGLMGHASSEEGRATYTRATKNTANGNSKGVIVAIDIGTGKPKFLYGSEDMRREGFYPGRIYEILSTRNDFTHHGHIFIREQEVFGYENDSL